MPQREGYYSTPNTNIPLNNRLPGDLAQVAIDQLAEYQMSARGWAIEVDINDPRECHRCGECGQNIWFGCDLALQPYQYTEEEQLTLIVAHLRQVHSD
jgi:hypothetical protein